MKTFFRGSFVIITMLLITFAVLISLQYTKDQEPRSVSVDKTAGMIKLPLNEFMASNQELQIIQTAQSLFMRKCYEKAGYSINTPKETNTKRLPERRYGLWQMTLAEKYGYALPASFLIEDTKYERELSKISETDRTYCMQKLTAQTFSPQPEVTNEIAVTIFNSFIESDDAKSVIMDWRKCLASVGVKTFSGRDGLYGLPDAGNNTDLQSIRIAVKDVKCKERTDLVRRMANFEGVQQQNYIKENLKLLTASREKTNQQVAASRRYLRENNMMS